MSTRPEPIPFDLASIVVLEPAEGEADIQGLLEVLIAAARDVLERRAQQPVVYSEDQEKAA
jgi:hypothetical protein